MELPEDDIEMYKTCRSVDYVKRNSCDINCIFVGYNINKEPSTVPCLNKEEEGPQEQPATLLSLHQDVAVHYNSPQLLIFSLR